MHPQSRYQPVTAILGPTNTGKTHIAIERILAHKSGMIGLPLRLLAREVYQKISERVGTARVALITGEERIKPFAPDYWVATIESMPLDLDVECVAIDEIQLAADINRGHTFTDRLLNMRGTKETLILGAETMRPLIETLLIKPAITSRKRFSTLSFSGHKKLGRLPPRTAVIAFSANQVYAIAEFIKRERGGASVILGALSPRTRNAQVNLYQSGEVDYFVATDAVGMGLNLDVDHVMFAGLTKFDGFQMRALRPAEMAQIAGRAGRYQRDGTFGVTGMITSLDPDLVHRLENHSFEAEKVLQWRNTALDFSSLQALRKSLDKMPLLNGLVRTPVGDDVKALEQLMNQPDIASGADSKTAVERLWECCQLPDYSKLSSSHHCQIIEDIYSFVKEGGLISNDWFAKQLKRCENLHGEIDALSVRIADIRTWSYIANRENWLDLSEGWRQKTIALENALSDRLHQLITDKFVHRKTSVLMRRLKETKTLQANVNETGEIAIEGESLGILRGFRFIPAQQEKTVTRLVSGTLNETVRQTLIDKVNAFIGAGNKTIKLNETGEIIWLGDVIGRLSAGAKLYDPSLELLADETLDKALKSQATERLKTWFKAEISPEIEPLARLMTGLDLEAAERGIALQLAENFGVLERTSVADAVKALDIEARRRLRNKGIRIGAYSLFMPLMLKPDKRKLVMTLAVLGGKITLGESEALHNILMAGRTSILPDSSLNKAAYQLAGYRSVGERLIRVDVLERAVDLIRHRSMWRPGATTPRPEGVLKKGFLVSPDILSLMGCGHNDLRTLMPELGYHFETRLKSEVDAELATLESEALAKEMEDDPFPVPPKPAENKTDNSAPVESDIGHDVAEIVPDDNKKQTPEISKMVDIWFYKPPRSNFSGKKAKTDKQNQPASLTKADKIPNKAAKTGHQTKQTRNGDKQKHRRDSTRPTKIDPDSPFAQLANLIKK